MIYLNAEMPFNIKTFFSLFRLNLKIWEAEKLIHEYVDPLTQVAPDGFYFEEKTTFFLLTYPTMSNSRTRPASC